LVEEIVFNSKKRKDVFDLTGKTINDKLKNEMESVDLDLLV